MKIFALILLFFGFLATSHALKSPECGLQDSKSGDGVRTCLAAFPAWSYKSATNECVDFVYGGCGGNENRFRSKEDCEQKCKE